MNNNDTIKATFLTVETGGMNGSTGNTSIKVNITNNKSALANFGIATFSC